MDNDGAINKRNVKEQAKKVASFVFTAILAFSMTCSQSLTQALAAEAASAEAQTQEEVEPATTEVSPDASETTTDEAVTDEVVTDDPITGTSEVAEEAPSDSGASEANPSGDESDISTMSTVDEEGKYSVVVDYVDASTGEKVAPSYETVLDKGDAWSADSPTIEGYDLHDATQTSVSGTASGDDHWIVLTVSYDAASAAYTVVHMKQMDGDGDSGYYVADTETLTGIAGQTVTVEPKTYEGYTCATSDRALRVTADGKASLTLYYDQDQLNWCVWFTTHGSYVAGITAHAGDTLTAPADPTRVGYTFVGWDTTGDGVADGLPAIMPAHNIDATAVWKPAEVGYVINYYQQNTDGTTYTLERTVSSTGTTGDTTPTAPLMETGEGGDYAYFYYAHEDPVTIKADGTSVLNVYYDRVVVTTVVNLEMDDGSLKEYSSRPALYGVVDMCEWSGWLSAYKDAGGSKPYILSCRCDENGLGERELKRVASDTDFATKQATYTIRFSGMTQYSFYMFATLQGLDGVYGAIMTHASYTLPGADRGAVCRRNSLRGFTCIAACGSTNLVLDDPSTAQWGTWITSPNVVNSTNGVEYFRVPTNGVEHNASLFKFKRNSYTATYYSNGVAVATKSHLYEEPYSTSEVDGSSLTSPAEGLSFGGWYDNEHFTGEPVTSVTQGIDAEVYYAKWVPSACTVTFDSNGGTPVASEEVAKGSTASEPTDPTKTTGDAFLGWYYYGDAAASAEGGSGTPSRYSFDKTVEGDITLVAQWGEGKDSVGYTVIHQTKDGTVLARETGTGTIGASQTVAALATSDVRRAGHPYVDAGYQSIVLTSDASANVVTFTYSDDADYVYTVRYVSRDTGESLVADNVFGSDSNLVALKALDIAGYTVEDGDGWVSADKTAHTFYYVKDAVADTTAQPTTTFSSTATPQGAVAVSASGDDDANVKVVSSRTGTALSEIPRTGDSTEPGAVAAIALCGLMVLVLAGKHRGRRA